MALAARRWLSLEEAVALDEASPVPLEYLDGRVYFQGVEVDDGRPLEEALRNMAGGSPRHAELAGSVVEALRGALREAGRGGCRVYTSDLRVYVPDGRFVHPDVSVVCGGVVPPFHDEGGVTNPSVLVEVLSPTTEAYDRGEKFERVRAIPSLRHYVLVSQRRASVETYTRGEAGTWILRAAGPGDDVQLEALGVRISLAALYAGIALDPEPLPPPEVAREA